MKFYTQELRVTGYVKKIYPDQSMFEIEARSGDIFQAYTNGDTSFSMIRNTDKMDRDRVESGNPNNLEKYLHNKQLISAYGILLVHEENRRFDIKKVTIFGNEKNEYVFEEGHWWLTQITSFADVWLKRQFERGDNFDFTGYRTNLTSTGGKTNDDTQECDTIARLIYGLSSAYILTGNHRYLKAAAAGVKYQREMFRTISHDGKFVVWHHAIKDGEKILNSTYNEDAGTIPLYEQIYALAGLAQYYKATADWEALYDIRRTLNFFEESFRDKALGGYFSHIDPANFKHNSSWLKNNKNKKNWNSVGDHAPAYLINLMLSIEGIPEFKDSFETYKVIQKELADLICDKFYDENCRYVKERFNENWEYDDKYEWQQDRAVIGHNLKIAWNLIRLYNFFGDEKYLSIAEKIADKIPEGGLDMIRGGWFDVVERNPKNGIPIEFPWHTRKAWWQQEQAILAYLILCGVTKNEEKKTKYLQLARESIAFWNLSFLNSDYGETYFDVLDNGEPYIKDDRAQSASHSKSGYHSMELNYLAHIYLRLLVKKDKPLRLYYCLAANRNTGRFNILPDYLPKQNLYIQELTVNGIDYKDYDDDKFQVLLHDDYRGQEVEIVVQIAADKNDKKPSVV